MDTDPKSPDSSSRATVTNTTNITSHLGEVLVCINAAAQLPLKLTSINFVSWKTQLHSLLIGYNFMGYINGSVQVPDDETNIQTRQDKTN
ncbi:hypothetical protein KY289_020000 [Solanum tuberosum]|nr:hypothetical protein KY289_020000 [Solanum tuberosum]